MKVNLHEPSFGEEEIQAACEQMRTLQVTMGKQVRKFEDQCAAEFETKHGVMCNSGSSANLLAIAAVCNPVTPCHLKAGDEVIVPALSWATTIWPIIQHGLVPVFVDCDLSTFNMSIECLKAAITKKTKAIMLVHVYGNPCDMDSIIDIAKENAFWVIEDCCEAMGAYYKEKPVGSLSHISTMSFYYSHHLTTFEGGICLTHSDEMADLLRILRAHGWSREADDKNTYIEKYPDIDPRFIFVNIGYNLRPTEVQAAIGMVQLPKLEQFVVNRRVAHSIYREELSKFKKYFSFQEEEKNSTASWFGFAILLNDGAPFSVKEITKFLQSKGIETRPIIAGNITRHPAMALYKHRISGNLGNSDYIMDNGFAIGCHQAITEVDLKYVRECFEGFIEDRSL